MRKGLLGSLNGIQPLWNRTHQLFHLQSLCRNGRGIERGRITDQTDCTQQQRLARGSTGGIPAQTLHLKKGVYIGTSLCRMFLNAIPKEPHEIARLLMIDKFVRTRMAHETLLSLFLGFPSQRNDPRNPLKGSRQITNLGTQSLT